MFLTPPGFRPRGLVLALCIAALAAALWLSSSSFRPEEGKTPVVPQGDSLHVGVYVVDGCEYLGIDIGTCQAAFTHKGDCKSSIHFK